MTDQPGPLIPADFLRTETWISDGVCGQTDPELFFPTKGLHVAEAKLVCAGCPVVVECANYGIDTEGIIGVWGGLSERDRRPYLIARKRDAA